MTIPSRDFSAGIYSPCQQLSVAGAGWQQGQGISLGTRLQAELVPSPAQSGALTRDGTSLLHPLGRAPSTGQGCSLQHIFQGLAGA